MASVQAALVAVGIAEVPHDGRPLVPVGAALEDRGGLREHGDGFVVAAELPVQSAQAAQDPGLGVRVGRLAGGVEGKLVGVFPGAPVSAPVEHDGQHLGEPPGPVPQPRGMNLPDQPHKAGSFRHEPAPGIAADDVFGEELLRGRGGDVRCAGVDKGGC